MYCLDKFCIFICTAYIIFISTVREVANEFEPCSKLEDLNLDVRNNSKETQEIFLADNFFQRYNTGPYFF